MKTINDYAELVKAEHALNKTIAPVEDGANIAGSYTSGKQFIRGGVLYTALTTIAANTAWSSLTLDTDYEVADDLTTQLASVNQTLTNKTDMLIYNGVVNLLPISAISQTVNGITFTVNSDGTITANGTATANAAIDIVASSVVNALRAAYGGTVRLTGCPANVGSSSYNMYVHYPSPSEYPLDGGDGLNITKDIDQIRIQVMNGQTVNNLVFKPMLSVPILNLSYDDYVPYAKTNRELTEDTIYKKVEITSADPDVSFIGSTFLVRHGRTITFVVNRITYPSMATNTYKTIATITDPDMIPQDASYAMVWGVSDQSWLPVMFFLNSNGQLTMQTVATADAKTERYIHLIGDVGMV